MKYFYKTLFFLFSISSLSTKAQQIHFIYFQTENKQQFFIKLDNKVFNAAPLGYIIIPKLQDGTYSFVIGFPQNNRVQQFNYTISKKDVGFLVKNSDDKGLQLLNLETLNILTLADVVEKNNNNNNSQEKEKDAFSTMLANAVHDSSILQKDIVKETVIQTPSDPALKDTSQNTVSKNIAVLEPVIKNESGNSNSAVYDSSAILNNAITKKEFPEKGNDQIQKDTSLSIILKDDVAYSIITRMLKKNNKDDIEMIYVDEHGSIKDTIRIVVPVEKSKKQAEEPKEIKTTEPNPVTTNTTVLSETPLKNLSDQDKKETTKLQPEKEIIKEEKKEPVFIKFQMINSDCKNFATDDDFLKLRKKMVAENNDEDMIKVAKKTFKIKCFTTEQLKNLSVLFLKDEGKYIFFDAAYPFVSNSDIYNTLESQLSDVYYITRFRAMIHK